MAQNDNGLILVQQLRYMDMIKILGLLKSFAFVMLSKLGALFKNGYTKLIKGYSPTVCPKKLKRAILVRKNGDIWILSK